MVRRSGRVGAVCNTVVKTDWVSIPQPSQITEMRSVPEENIKSVQRRSSYIKTKIQTGFVFFKISKMKVSNNLIHHLKKMREWRNWQTHLI